VKVPTALRGLEAAIGTEGGADGCEWRSLLATQPKVPPLVINVIDAFLICHISCSEKDLHA
jgi:hypothetical protein